jgi:hypothetical protein
MIEKGRTVSVGCGGWIGSYLLAGEIDRRRFLSELAGSLVFLALSFRGGRLTELRCWSVCKPNSPAPRQCEGFDHGDDQY